MRHLTALVLLALAATAHADEKVKALFRKCAPATVYVECKPDKEGLVHLGSGSIIDANGLILSNRHVVASCLDGDREVAIYLFDGRRFDAVVVQVSEELDLAILRLKDSPGELPVLEWGDSDSLEVGEDVIAIGNPDGLKWTLSTGIVSGKREDMIQTTAPLNPGNSGGPLISPEGKLIGVNTLSAYKDRNNIAFARTSNVSRDWVQKQLAAGEVVTPRFDDPAHGFSFTPPQGWALLGDNEKNPGQSVAYAGAASVIRVYLIPGAPKDIKVHAEEQEALLKKQLKPFERRSLAFLEFRGKTDAYSMTYAFAWDGADYVSYQVTVNDTDATWTLRFTCPAADHAKLQPEFDAVIQNARWSAGTAGRETPEKAMEAWVKALSAGNLDAFLACLDLPAWLDDATKGEYGKASPEDRKAMEARYREVMKGVMEKGDLAKQVEQGVRILAGRVDGAGATVGLVSVSTTGVTVVEEFTLANSATGWLVTGVGPAKAYEDAPAAAEDSGKSEVKRKKFRDESKSFSVQLPASWSKSSQKASDTVAYHMFSETGAAESVAKVAVSVMDVRADIEQDELSEDDLDTLAERFMEGFKGSFKAKFVVRGKDQAEVGGIPAVHFKVAAQADAFSPQIEAHIWFCFKNGWAYGVISVTAKGETPNPEFERIVGSFKATGKRK
ncbi:MAG: protease [Planctomycetota bacterium]|nr:MAG: protease [Planctomycetota bacterium]